MKKLTAAVVSMSLVIAGCATSSKDISATYISPLQYQNYDCGQIAAESQRIQTRVVELGGRLDQAANNDKAIMGVGLVLFWPALFMVGGTKTQEAEYGRLRGEYEAVQKAAVEKRCPGVVAPAAPVAASAATAR
jgi:outer membrane murein-binding lipoprotein Lpp